MPPMREREKNPDGEQGARFDLNSEAFRLARAVTTTQDDRRTTQSRRWEHKNSWLSGEEVKE